MNRGSKNIRKSLNLDVQDLIPGDLLSVKDENCTITALPLLPRSNSDGKKRPRAVSSEAEHYRESSKKARDILRLMFADETAPPLADQQPENLCTAHDELINALRLAEFPESSLFYKDLVLCYLIQNAELPRKFDSAKADRLQIPRGPIRARLVKGESVTLDDGRLITCEQVTSEPIMGAVTAYLDIPNEQYLEVLYADYADLFREKKPACVIYSLGTKTLMNSPIFHEWITKACEETTQHIILSADIYSMPQTHFRDSLIHQIRLNLANPNLVADPLHINCDNKLPEFTRKVHLGLPLMKFNLEPTRGLDRSSVPTPLNIEAAKHQQAQQFAALLKASSTENNEPPLTDSPKAKPVVTFLGTGSMMPSKYRNVSSIHVELENKSGILMDCGEATYGQITRFFGLESSRDVLMNLRCIFISHMHADHHLGTVRVLLERLRLDSSINKSDNSSSPILLIGPKAMDTFIQEYAKCTGQFDLLNTYTFLDARHLLPSKQTSPQLKSIHEFITPANDVLALNTASVDHCPDSYGILLTTHGSHVQLIYSGDTRPCQTLIKASRHQKQQLLQKHQHDLASRPIRTCLIHEATLEDSMHQEAIQRKHSTFSEAIGMGWSLQAHETLLTHFSQRYPRAVHLKDTLNRKGRRKQNEMAIGMAWDGIRVSFEEVNRLFDVALTMDLWPDKETAADRE